MHTPSNFKDQLLLRAIDEVLHYIWDPIGVAGIPQARDEYAGYVASVYSWLRAGAPESEISAHLTRIADENMGLPGREEKSAEAAAVLTDWRDFNAETGV